MVERCAYMDECSSVDNQKPVMKPVGNLDRKRTGILGVELRNIDIVQKPVSGVLHYKHRNALALLGHKWQHTVGKIGNPGEIPQEEWKFDYGTVLFLRMN